MDCGEADPTEGVETLSIQLRFWGAGEIVQHAQCHSYAMAGQRESSALSKADSHSRTRCLCMELEAQEESPASSPLQGDFITFSLSFLS